MKRALSRSILAVMLFSAVSAHAQFSESSPYLIGRWDPVFNWPVVAIHAHVMPDGKVVTWERKDSVLTTEVHIWDPNTGVFSRADTDKASLFCSGHTFLSDGRLFTAGGHVYDDHFGAQQTLYFNGSSWTEGPLMNAGRWYPTATTLRNGDVLVTGGSINGSNNPNRTPQVWQKSNSQYRNLVDRTVPLYPMMFQAPANKGTKVFMAGPDAQSMWLDTTTGAWTDGPISSGGFRDYGTAVEYQPGKLLLVGGGTPTATAQTIDLNAGTPTWQSTYSMSAARRHLNATILPTGKVFVSGGTSATGFNNADGTVQTNELWDPYNDGRWTTMAVQHERRLYHSTAVLLKDGRVLSMGGGMPYSPQGADWDHRTAQIYKPTYHQGQTKPTITSVSASNLTPGQTFTVTTPNASSITAVTMVRLSSVTHSLNMSQRFHQLSFVRGTGQLTVTAPSNDNWVPGPYFLFVIVGGGDPAGLNGIPSIGKEVYLQ